MVEPVSQPTPTLELAIQDRGKRTGSPLESQLADWSKQRSRAIEASYNLSSHPLPLSIQKYWPHCCSSHNYTLRAVEWPFSYYLSASSSRLRVVEVEYQYFPTKASGLLYLVLLLLSWKNKTSPKRDQYKFPSPPSSRKLPLYTRFRAVVRMGYP